MGELGDTVRVVRAAEGDYVESRGARARVQVRVRLRLRGWGRV